ncbi:hypothetical protein UPYG_G00040750 [Umbra pygmaea]|uniref:Protein Shroom2-like n=1 Tax=Umbra pygmaea TaxID=75934 RepID=A0ABD0XS87_UMBPY
MDTDSRSDPRYSDGDHKQWLMERPGDMDQRSRDGVEGWRLVEFLLSGGAPWGFTLKGGREHREPLLITKVEEGSQAAAVGLQVGDELVNINQFPLTGYRQEAICLVKGSHKTLSLVVKRRNEPVNRPHSWHATKLNEVQSETTKPQSSLQYDASSSSTDLSSSCGWDQNQTNLRRASDQFSSLGSMDSLDPGLEPVSVSRHPSGRLSPAKSHTSTEHLGEGKRDSAYSSFSTSSGTPDYTLSKTPDYTKTPDYNLSKTADDAKTPDYTLFKNSASSTENMLSHVIPGVSGSQPSNVRHSQSLGIEGLRQGERQGCLQPAGGQGVGWGSTGTDQHPEPGSRHSSSSVRASSGPVWHVPEKRKTSSPPPPPLPVRIDSFAAIKSHEKGLVMESAEESKAPENSQHTSDAHGGQHILASNTVKVPVHISPESSSQNHLDLNKLYSVSSSDVRHGQNLQHPRQHSHPRTSSGPKQHSSMQDLPTNYNIQNTQLYSQLKTRLPSTALSSTASEQIADGPGASHHYRVADRQPGQPVSQAQLVKTDNKRSAGGHRDTSHRHPATATVTAPPSSEGRRRASSQTAEPHNQSCPPIRQADQRRSLSLQQRDVQQDISSSARPSPFSPQTSPMLLSLSQEAPNSSVAGGQTAPDLSSGKQSQRTERFATTLRNEIQMRRAKLQKSQSSAALSEPYEAEDDYEMPEVSTSTSPSDGSFTLTYKDHLKEAQARVLKATSFRRRDLEPVTLEHTGVDAGSQSGYSSSALGKKDNLNPLPQLSEDMPARSSSAQGQVTRIGGRKRFPVEKKVRSFSEPDKINEVGVDAELTNPGVSESSSSRLAFTRPLPKASSPASVEEGSRASVQARGNPWKVQDQREAMTQLSPPNMYRETEGPHSLDPQQKSLIEQQRLGTFAEYEATWNIQKKPAETRPSGRYHSADNILDPGGQDRAKPGPLHVRSRSSPSADFCSKTHNVLAPERKSAEYSRPESKPVGLWNPATRQSGEWKATEKTEELEDFPEPPSPVTEKQIPDIRPPTHPYALLYDPGTNTAPDYQRHASISDLPVHPPDQHSHTDPHPPSTHPENSHFQESLPGSQCGEHSPAPVSSHSPRKDSEQSRGLVKKERGAVHQVVPLHSGPALPSLPFVAPPTMEGQHHRSPSPQFAPQRLTDRPPVYVQQPQVSPVPLQHGTSTRVEPACSSVRKVPIKIVHSESEIEKESRQYLLRHSDCPMAGAPGPCPAPLSTLVSSGPQSYSPFCAYNRQRDSHLELERAPAPPNYPAPVLPAPYQSLAMAQKRDYTLLSYQNALPTPPPSQQAAPPTTPPSQQAAPPTTPPSQQAAPPTIPHSQQSAPPTHPTNQQTAPPPNPLSGNILTTPSEEDVKREELARDIVDKDRSLADVLDQSGRKTTMDLMEGLFPQGEVLLEGKERRKVSPKHTKSPRASESRSEESVALAGAMVTNSTYYSTSAPKAELLIKLKDMQEREEIVEEQEAESEEELDHDLANKKQELVNSLSRKLDVLREARESLRDDVEDNNALGQQVEAVVLQLCKPNQLDKFRMFVGDLDKVVSLLLSLSGRLARVENALNSLEEEAAPEERRTLSEKRQLLIRQHDDAKELKENLDRRERAVYDILASYLREDSLADYQHFVKMKSALIIEQRKLDDKIKLGEEQLKCLMDSLPLEQRMTL